MTRLGTVFGVLLLCVLSVRICGAHEVRPAYLEISQSGASTYRVVWKRPTLGDRAIHLVPHLSNGWLEQPPQDQYAAAGFLISTWSIDAPTDALAGSILTIESLEFTITDVLVRIRRLDGALTEAIVRPENPRFEILSEGEQARLPVFFIQGIEHILAGVDHLLFVLGLLLIVRSGWTLFTAVTAFTIAHSLTLAAAMLGRVTLDSAFVETLIALSILFLGLEVLRARRGGSSLAIRHPWAVAFFFGLFHGMGFAGGLRSLGLPPDDLLGALLFFNLGVEAGQLAFIAAVLLAARGWSRLRGMAPFVQANVPAYIVGIAGAYWTFQTAAVLLGIS
jgi:hydrogenase/urease accessory protein HupE